jgi:preprotein translocase subunit SecA
MSEINPQDFGELKAQVAMLTKQNDIVNNKLDAQNETLKSMKEVLDKAQGGWRMLVTVGTVCAGLGAGIVSLFELVKQK